MYFFKIWLHNIKKLKKLNKILKYVLTNINNQYYNYTCRKTNASKNADVAELADAQDLKSCG